MKSHESIEKMKKIHAAILDYIDNADSNEENYQNIDFLLKGNDIIIDQFDFKLFLHLLVKNANHHHRSPNFFEKIDKILMLCKKSIIKFYTNYEIFQIFHSNKRLLLFIIEEKLMTIDIMIFSEMISLQYKKFKYAEYFAPEVKSFVYKILEKNFRTVIGH